MRTLLLFLVLPLTLLYSCCNKRSTKKNNEHIIKSPDTPPEFPGGVSEMYKFISSNLKTPLEAKKANISGRLLAKFIVERNGAISNISIIKGIGFGYNKEFIRVIELMPKWEPAQHMGEPVRTAVTLPVNCLGNE